MELNLAAGRRILLEAHELSVTEAARILRVSRPALSSLLNAKADLSGEMALRFEKAFGVEMETLTAVSAAALTISATSLTSCRARSWPPLTLRRIPRAPSIELSKREELIAISAAF